MSSTPRDAGERSPHLQALRKERTMAKVQEPPGELHDVTIVLESPTHFHAPNSSDVQVHPGAYHVSIAHDGHLALGAMQNPEHHGTVLRAFRTWHSFRLTAPLAVSVAQHDSLHIVLLLPGGGALQATGSLRPATKLADTPTFATPHDLAQAMITRLPFPKHSQPFNPATVLAVPGIRPWGTIDPGNQPTPFGPGSVPPNWISATVTACKSPYDICPVLERLCRGIRRPPGRSLCPRRRFRSSPCSRGRACSSSSS